MTSASANDRGIVCERALLVEPCLRLGFRDDREDLDLRFSNVIEHPDVIPTQSILRLRETPVCPDTGGGPVRASRLQKYFLARYLLTHPSSASVALPRAVADWMADAKTTFGGALSP